MVKKFKDVYIAELWKWGHYSITTKFFTFYNFRLSGVREQVKAFETSGHQHQDTLQKPKQQKPNSAAYDLFETKGILISQVS